ncbi:hypothetical protein llap_7069 [Limosa lapponica baueri]|uniref:Uncharacterized protein n=1 Tax=Limosa lapponica baueri TaxID=1758121 RepID=A0A2I0U994_LIMLA|nr:hypothetical protein llap_7069 [Limosa lapponica baueri]
MANLEPHVQDGRKKWITGGIKAICLLGGLIRAFVALYQCSTWGFNEITGSLTLTSLSGTTDPIDTGIDRVTKRYPLAAALCPYRFAARHSNLKAKKDSATSPDHPRSRSLANYKPPVMYLRAWSPSLAMKSVHQFGNNDQQAEKGLSSSDCSEIVELIQTRMSQTRSRGRRMSAVVLWLDRSPDAWLGTLINTSGEQGSPVTAGLSLLSPSLFVS